MIKKIKYIIVLFICFFTFNISVKAYTSYINYDTNFNVNSFFDYSTLLNNSRCHDETYYQFINEFISSLDFVHSRYHLFITFSHYNNPSNYNKGYFHFYAIPKSFFTTQQFDISFSRTSSGSNGYLGQFNSIYLNLTGVQRLEMTLGYLYNIDYDFCSNSNYNSFLESNVVSTFISYFNDLEWQQGISITEQYLLNSYFSTSSGSLININFDPSAQLFNIPYTNSPSTLNSNSVDIEGFYLPFYSSYPLTFSSSITYPFSSNELVFKKNIYLVINQTRYGPGDIFPTFYDLIMNPTSESFIDYKPRLGTIYTNFSPQSVNNFELDISFNSNLITALEYYNNLGYTWNCYGRKNNNNEYYSYEMFSYCDFETFLNSNGNSFNLSFENFNIYDSNDNIITDFSAYDKLFLYIDFQYKDSNLSQVVSNLKLNFTGNVYFEDNFRGPIYDDFYNLPINFKIFLSTSKKDYSYLYGKYISSNNNSLFSIRRQEYNIYNLGADINPGYFTSYFSRYSVNNALNTGLMVFQSPSSIDEDTFVGLEFVFFQDIIISIRGDSSNSFSYYDNTGSIINSNITIDYSNVPENNYDITYYVSQINDFIDSLTDSSLEFSSITQMLYDGMPFIFQSFIFIIFVLFCTYFTFLLIKK